MRFRQAVFALFIVPFLFSATEKKKEKHISPPGTVWLRDNLYIDTVPVNNVNLRIYEYVMGKVRYNLGCFKAYEDSMLKLNIDAGVGGMHYDCNPNPDSNNIKLDPFLPVSWSKEHPAGYYEKIPRYDYYPCVDINYETAKAFCDWRSQSVMIRNKIEYGKHPPYTKVTYRLPTQEEWEYALEKFKDNLSVTTGPLDSTCYVKLCDRKSRKQFYCLSNISEMVLEKGVAKGANWKDAGSNGNINFTTKYTQPGDWLGFRCICEVKE